MIEAVLKGLGFGLLLSIAVGPVLFSIIKQSLNNGYRGHLHNRSSLEYPQPKPADIYLGY